MQAPLPPMLRALMQAILPIETNNLATPPARVMARYDWWHVGSAVRVAVGASRRFDAGFPIASSGIRIPPLIVL